MGRACSSQVYQVTPMPAIAATSSRRRPGVLAATWIGFLVSHHWLYFSYRLYHTDAAAVAAGMVAAGAAMAAAVTQLPAVLALLVVGRASARWWLPPSWALGEAGMERLL